MRRVIVGLAMAASLSGAVLGAPSAAELVEEGNRLYAKGDHDGALKRYLEAAALVGEKPELSYNIGDVHYAKGKFPEAAAEFRRVLEKADPGLLPPLAYNLATAAAKQKEVQKAIDLYKAAIKMNPRDVEARHNLGVLLEQQQKEQQQQQQQNQDQQKQDQQKKDQQQQEQQQKQDEQKKQDQQQQQQQQDQQKQEKEQQQAQQGEEKKDEKEEQKPAQPIQQVIPREQAERLLDLLKDEERQGLILGAPQPKADEPVPEKDW